MSAAPRADRLAVRAPAYEVLVDVLAASTHAPFLPLPKYNERAAAAAAAVADWPAPALDFAVDAAAGHFRARARAAAAAVAAADVAQARPGVTWDDGDYGPGGVDAAAPAELDIGPLRARDAAAADGAHAAARLASLELVRAVRAAVGPGPDGAPPAVAAPPIRGALGALAGAAFLAVAPVAPPPPRAAPPPLPPKTDAAAAAAAAVLAAMDWATAEDALLRLGRAILGVPDIHVGVALLQAACDAATPAERAAAVGPATVLAVYVTDPSAPPRAAAPSASSPAPLKTRTSCPTRRSAGS